MEALPERRKKKGNGASFVLSIVLHAVLGLIVFFVAAREGLLGKKLREITAVVVPEEKKPKEEKKEEPKPEVARPKDEPKPVETVRAVPAPAPTVNAPPPGAAPTAAPPPVIGADFAFSDGAKEVATTSDPRELYKSAVEYAFRSRWQKPDDLEDAAYVAEAVVRIAPDGRVLGAQLTKGSGDNRWDAAVRTALAATRDVGRKPPKGFPDSFTVRFDAVAEEAAVGGTP